MNGDYNFVKDVCGESDIEREVEVPLNLLLALAECRGRMRAMHDYAKAHKYNFNSNDLAIIGGFEFEEQKENASM